MVKIKVYITITIGVDDRFLQATNAISTRSGNILVLAHKAKLNKDTSEDKSCEGTEIPEGIVEIVAIKTGVMVRILTGQLTIDGVSR